MYRVRVLLRSGSFSVTSHSTAAETFRKIVNVREAGVKVTVEDRYFVELSDNRLIELMAKEDKRHGRDPVPIPTPT